jgi:hypothetical protein
MILGNGKEVTSAPEPSFLPKSITQRFTVYNASTTDELKAVITLGLYRQRTI